ncbi:conserved hypothetical protein [Sporisorium reilianum SRZ2]|uniref:Uncharacterized protein n=1 Tax=Sporisorium reilianum (strain SRZ2) TaxID=999809 RepID=E6ZMF3_SPORE|nr:conserved hypothetical protein [Sporisorium reilianum SRZ2]
MAAAAATAAMPHQRARLGLATRPARPILSIDALQPKPSFAVPSIVITPPDTPPSYSASVPEQQYEKSVLFVPVKTEELGWDEHGLYWNGTYAYPVHQIYDKEGQPIGRRRKGPHGYRFEEYYHNKRPRRSAPSSSMLTPAAGEDTVEEASVRLDEPAPASPQLRAEEVAMDEDELRSPSSPTLSLASDATETDASSLWSRCDDAESRCTSPGTVSPPPMDLVDSRAAEVQAEALSQKLAHLPAEKVSKTAWLSLGTLPSAAASTSSRSQSLPTARSPRAKPALDTREARRHSTPSAYASIISDLSTSPFASSSTPNRASTLPRAPSRSAYAHSKHSLLRPPPQYTSFVRTQRSTSASSARRASADTTSRFDPDFAAGWTFENPTSAPLTPRF